MEQERENMNNPKEQLEQLEKDFECISASLRQKDDELTRLKINTKYAIVPTQKERQFINSYIEAIYLTDTGDIDQPHCGVSLDEGFERESIIDCLAFYSRVELYLPPDNISQAGDDFWLTRNRHGVGFLDRGDSYGKFAQWFTDIAHSFGEVTACFDEIAKD
jgi:hypothetical protein